jgi:hypothetical protein
MPFPIGLRALNHRDYRLCFAGQLISLIGTWMQRVALSCIVALGLLWRRGQAASADQSSEETGG